MTGEPRPMDDGLDMMVGHHSARPPIAPKRKPDVSPLVTASYTAATVIALIMLMSGMGWFQRSDAVPPPVEVRMVGYLGVMLVLTLGPIAYLLVRRPAGGHGASPSGMDDVATDLRELLQQSGLSDDARRVLNRRRERELLRKAIEEDIAIHDWDAAMVLVRELAERFGYRSDAEEFRSRIEQARFETVERRVMEAMQNFDGLLVQRRWDEARVEAARIARLYPESPKIDGLRHRVEEARTQYKHELERRFREASDAGRADEAMKHLRELDQYLSEREAEPLREMARGVIGRVRESMGVQFKAAVQDKHWHRAIDLGERIIAEFPNSRMAHEVREMIDSLRARANEGDPAQVGAES